MSDLIRSALEVSPAEHAADCISAFLDRRAEMRGVHQDSLMELDGGAYVLSASDLRALLAERESTGQLVVAFTIPGEPVAQGSMVAAISRTTGKPFVKSGNEAKLRRWRTHAATVAGEAFRSRMIPKGVPLMIEARFYFERPKNQHGTGRNSAIVKASAPPVPVVRPDGDKLCRALFDALTGVIYADDAQIATHQVWKLYADATAEPRTEIVVRRMEEAG